ncbi:uncharacterized protein LOC133862202 [Alnus glutinosa]|uniref:uncharacterized protein LOC133862202 n=1 Tax=Alnus glutinosa TaxID=3517 RepID=UPI002D77FE8C|nr:uncharacterized protein LOC133862202 [Alnus glutinosa]
MVSIRSKLVKEAFSPNSDEFPQNHLCSKLVNLVIYCQICSSGLRSQGSLLSSYFLFLYSAVPRSRSPEAKQRSHRICSELIGEARAWFLGWLSSGFSTRTISLAPLLLLWRSNFQLQGVDSSDGQLEKLKVDQYKVYLRRNGLRLTGNKGLKMEGRRNTPSRSLSFVSSYSPWLGSSSSLTCLPRSRLRSRSQCWLVAFDKFVHVF